MTQTPREPQPRRPHGQPSKAQVHQQETMFKQMGAAGRRLSAYGGGTRKGKRKIRRPFARNKPMHIVLKASPATGELSMLRPKRRQAIENLVYKIAAQHGVTVMNYQNVGNHLHMLLRSGSEKSFKHGMRVMTSLIARLVTGARKGRPFAAQDVGAGGIRGGCGSDGGASGGSGSAKVSREGSRHRGKFWDATYYSRLTFGLRDLQKLARYFEFNSADTIFGPWGRDLYQDFLRRQWAGFG